MVDSLKALRIKMRPLSRRETISLFFLFFILLTVPLSLSLSRKQQTYPTSAESTGSINKKIQLLIFNPTLPSHGGQRLIDYEHWNDPDKLTTQVIKDLQDTSNGLVNFTVADRQVIDSYNQLIDGFIYNEDTYLACLADSTKCHDPWQADYNKILTDYQSCEKLNSGQIDEVWLWGGPGFGYNESRLAGPGAFWYNSDPVTNTTCQKLLPIMGFSYERAVSEALEDFLHRIEAVMTRVYGDSWLQDENTPWDTFSLYDKALPGHARCGNTHNAPNSLSGYDWGNERTVPSACDDWQLFPNLPNPPNYRKINCHEWGCGAGIDAGYLYKKWWLRHLPKNDGSYNGKATNWWRYGFDFENTFGPNLPPISKFLASPMTGVTPLTVNFTNLAIDPNGDRMGFYWGFDDLGISYDVNTSHTFTLSDPTVSQTFNVILEATDVFGAKNLATTPIIVYPPGTSLPVASFTPAPITGDSPLTVKFTNQSSSHQQLALSYSWNFGDGSPASSETSPTHTFQLSNKQIMKEDFPVILKVTDSKGFVSETARVVSVQANQLPIANFTWKPYQSCQSNPCVLDTYKIVFTNTSVDPDNDPLTYLWDFGDKTTSTKKNPTHTYPRNTGQKKYQVTLTVRDNHEGQSQKTISVTVGD